MAINESIVYSDHTILGDYQVVDMIYTKRPARVLRCSNPKTDQAGIALDGNSKMLFAYNRRFMELVEATKPKSILLIGGGVYTLPMAIQASYSGVIIDVVEPNSDLDDIATRFFNFRPSHRLNIYHKYGLDYLSLSAQKYDLILVDAYLGESIPEEIISTEFASLMSKALSKDGLVAINVISTLLTGSPLKLIVDNYGKSFKHIKVHPAERSLPELYSLNNYILLAGHDDFNIKLHFQAIEY